MTLLTPCGELYTLLHSTTQQVWFQLQLHSDKVTYILDGLELIVNVGELSH